MYGFTMYLADPSPVRAPQFQPQCLRTRSASYFNDPLQIYASLPSFPKPYGGGWFDNPDTVRCGGQ